MESGHSLDVYCETFTQWSDLMEHKQIHSGEQTLSCDVSNKIFSRRSFLITHQRYMVVSSCYPVIYVIKHLFKRFI